MRNGGDGLSYWLVPNDGDVVFSSGVFCVEERLSSEVADIFFLRMIKFRRIYTNSNHLKSSTNFENKMQIQILIIKF